MRPGANRRDHAVQPLSTSAGSRCSFNEARRESPGSHDTNQNAHLSILLATGGIPKDAEEQYKPRVNEELGSDAARAASLTPERRSEIARKAATARWEGC